MEEFAATLLADLHRYLVARGAADERMPECPDVEGKWTAIVQVYLPDGAREFADYPIASLGWMMFIGMAIAQYWDEDWNRHDAVEDLYTPLRDARGYDHMDEYILDEVLGLHGDEAEAVRNLVGDCAERAKRILFKQDIEPGTADALNGYIACLKCMYQAGMAVRLKSLGYRMQRL